MSRRNSSRSWFQKFAGKTIWEIIPACEILLYIYLIYNISISFNMLILLNYVHLHLICMSICFSPRIKINVNTRCATASLLYLNGSRNSFFRQQEGVTSTPRGWFQLFFWGQYAGQLHTMTFFASPKTSFMWYPHVTWPILLQKMGPKCRIGLGCAQIHIVKARASLRVFGSKFPPKDAGVNFLQSFNTYTSRKTLLPRSLTVRPWKFTSISQEGKACLPTIIFQWRAVKRHGCTQKILARSWADFLLKSLQPKPQVR